MRGPKPWRRFRAFVTGYFWLPCPSCGNHFAGSEWADIDGHHSNIGDQGICPDCTRAGVGDAYLLHQAGAEGQPEWLLDRIRARLASVQNPLD